MSKYKIEKDIPVPSMKRKSKYPFSDMEVGDSVFLPLTTSRVGGRITHYRKKGIGLISRKEGTGCRVWRVS